MKTAQPWTRLVAALTGFLGVAVGAFAAHAVTDPHARELARTAVTYGMVHAAAALALEGRAPWAAACLAGGGLVFSAPLYALALGAPGVIGAITPIGGLLMLGGWALAAWSAIRRRA